MNRRDAIKAVATLFGAMLLPFQKAPQSDGGLIMHKPLPAVQGRPHRYARDIARQMATQVHGGTWGLPSVKYPDSNDYKWDVTFPQEPV